MNKLRTWLILSFILCPLSGCKAANHAVAVVATAVAMEAAQHAVKKRRKKQQDYKCTMFCGDGEIPCGDNCVPQRTLCFEPPRHACYGGDPSIPARPASHHTGPEPPGAVIVVSPLHY